MTNELAASHREAPGKRRVDKIGKFDVLDSLGKGAGSTLLKVLRQEDGKIYALKLVKVESPEDVKYVDQSEHEYEIGSEFDHPNLVKVYCFEKAKSFFGKVTGCRLLLEYVNGMALSKCIGWPVGKLVEIFAQVAAGLAYMHGKGVYHADIKPDNVLITNDSRVKIIDFGLAWRQGERKDRVQGTLEFLAPEQARQKIVTAKTDVFNFGATMYRVLTGTPVPEIIRSSEARSIKQADSFVQSLRDHNEGVPPELDALVRECLKQDPKERPRIMSEVAKRLRDIGKQLRAKG